MRIRVGAASDVGRVREGNEDAFLVREDLVAIADGMGGHLGGEVASSLALEVLDRLSERADGSLTERIEEANRAVLERSRRDRAVAGMGTTLTAIAFGDDKARLAHVGDSRAYRLRDGELVALTEDHTLVQEMVRSGEITEEEARSHPQRNVILRSVGMDANVEVDEGEVSLRVRDRLLLCSDGLSGMVEDDRIRDLLSENQDDPEAAAQSLVAEANGRGGVDNITVVVVDVLDDPS